MASRTNLFVGGLPPQCNDVLLRQYFAPYGAIISAKAMVDLTTGQCKGFGFVQYSDAMAAATAMASMNGAQMDGSVLQVKLADREAGDKGPKPNMMSMGQSGASYGAMGGMGFGALATPAPPSDNVFVGGVPLEWSEAELNSLFGTCGTIVSSVIMVDKTTGRSKGAGLVRFQGVVGAAQAVQTFNGYQVPGTTRRLEVRFADKPETKGAKQAVKQVLQTLRFSPYGQTGLAGMMAPLLNNPQAAAALSHIQTPSVGQMGSTAFMNNGGSAIRVPRRADIEPDEGANLHVFGLDHEINDLHLYQAFGGYGAIRSVRVVSDKMTKAPKGYGFVQFFNVQDAHNAMAALNGIQVGNRAWQISIHQKKA